jgi:N-acetylglucosamine-6-phosphate deacetylase
VASLYPAMVIGINGEYGLIQRGYKADIVIFNNQIQVIGTVKSGQLSLK